MPFDSRCFELAEYFLAGEEPPVSQAKKAQLAQVIDDAIHDWLDLLHDGPDND